MRRYLGAREAWNEDAMEPLVGKVIGGDERAWHALWLALDPEIERIAGRRRVLGQLCRARYDDRRDVVVRVMGALRANGWEVLGKLHERLKARDGSSRPWFSAMVKHQAISHARAHAENLEGEGASRWAEHVAIPEGLPAIERDPSEAAARAGSSPGAGTRLRRRHRAPGARDVARRREGRRHRRGAGPGLPEGRLPVAPRRPPASPRSPRPGSRRHGRTWRNYFFADAC